jgi:hypothetical protein
MSGSTNGTDRKELAMADRRGVWLWRISGLLALSLVAAACGGGVSASEAGGDLSVRILSPADGASVSEPFTVKLDSSVPLGDPSTGDHHVHLCFDGANCDSEYTLVYGDSIPVKDLPPGEHTIEASLRNADHSDAGAPTDSITVTINGGDATGSGSDGATSSTMSPGYGH